MAKKEQSFEDAMMRLESIVDKMERGDISLEESLSLFEEGASLVKLCSKKLDNAQMRVVQLVSGPQGELEEKEFEHEDIS